MIELLKRNKRQVKRKTKIDKTLVVSTRVRIRYYNYIFMQIWKS